MKKIVIIILFSSILWACNHEKHSDHNANLNTSEKDSDQHESKSINLTLNNGAKWKADSTTNKNVKSLLISIQSFNDGADKSLLAYKNIAMGLQGGLNKMISECKMQGAEHEALHRWLEPLIEQVSKLKNAATVADAAQLYAAIQNQANLYNQYFK